MSKVYLKAVVNIVVDTDLQGADNIMENLDVSVTSESENVWLIESEIENFHIEDAK